MASRVRQESGASIAWLATHLHLGGPATVRAYLQQSNVRKKNKARPVPFVWGVRFGAQCQWRVAGLLSFMLLAPLRVGAQTARRSFSDDSFKESVALPLAAIEAKATRRMMLDEVFIKEDAAAIHAAVALKKQALGDQAGMPEESDVYQPVPAEAKQLTRAEARAGMARYLRRMEQSRFWLIGVDPTTLTGPLRVPASVVGGMVTTVQAKLDGADRCLAFAKDTADFLIWAQHQAGAGCYPFPATRSGSTVRSMQAGARLMECAAKAGRLEETVRNGWIFEDHGDGGLQFDNGECGVAMFELYAITHDARYLDSARQAADWALARPLCPNWNYNAFSVQLLAKAAAVTREPKYLAAALKKARLGVMPGQLTDGPRAGRWLDPHNARPAYHYIMMGALAQLAAVMPADHPDRALVMAALTLGLQARNAEIVAQGVMTKDKAIETLLLVHALFAAQPAFLTATKTLPALDILCRLASEESRSGKLPLGPRAWGMMLVYLSAPDSE